MVATAFIETHLPLTIAGVFLVGVATVYWSIIVVRLPLILLFLSLVLGQLGRLSLPGQGGGLLASDIAVCLLIITAVFYHLKNRNKKKIPFKAIINSFSLLVGLFGAWSLWLLCLHGASLGAGAFLISLAYWIRLILYLLVLPSLLILYSEKTYQDFVRKGLFIVIITLFFLGCLQMIFYSNLSFLARFGWDPHQGRLVSTWLDPNFFGAFLIGVLFFFISSIKNVSRKLIAAVFTLFLLATTQSRSSLLALTVTVMLISPLAMWHWFKVGKNKISRVVLLGSFISLGIVYGLFGVYILGDRATRFFADDPTVALRLNASKKVFALAQEQTFKGVGYNAYQYAALDAGLISDFNIHSRAGADNSWATIWITTGLTGFVLFLLPWVLVCRKLIIIWIKNSNAQAFCALAFIIALGIHSQFVNSFLYGHLLILLALVVFVGLSGGIHDTGKSLQI